jgi:hypothetical protein
MTAIISDGKTCFELKSLKKERIRNHSKGLMLG